MKKGLVSYFKSNDIIALKKHANVDHGLITKKNWRINEQQREKSPMEKQLAKKKHTINESVIFNFLGGHRSL